MLGERTDARKADGRSERQTDGEDQQKVVMMCSLLYYRYLLCLIRRLFQPKDDVILMCGMTARLWEFASPFVLLSSLRFLSSRRSGSDGSAARR
jgi:hypothetical protein